jgi:hypothetical protein
MTSVPNARFWVWHKGWVKLTLRPGQSISTYYSSRTDEGWASEEDEWEHDGEAVVRHWSEDGVDCDGRLSRSGVAFCTLANLRAVDQFGLFPEPDNWGIFRPEWEHRSSRQRDYAAEVAGY